MNRQPGRRAWFRLALALGIPVGELQSRMGSSEFAEWMAFDRIDPIGPERDDLRIGILGAGLAKAFGMKRKGGGEIRATDFMADYAGAARKRKGRRQPRRQSQAAMKALLLSLPNGRIRGKNGTERRR